MGQKLLCFLNRYYRVDPRAAALLRIGVALLLLLDLSFRFGDISALYCDEGLWPVKVMFHMGWQKGYWTIHGLSGHYYWVVLLFALHFFSALFLLLGYKTRIFSVLCWLLLISLHNRNLFVLQAGDDLLRIVLFWGIFLNWGRSWSLDAVNPVRQVSSLEQLSGFAYLLLLASVYLFTTLLKSGEEWHAEGSAIYYSLSLDQMRLPYSGDLIYQFPSLLKLLSRLVYGIELVLPFLILWPSKNGNLRGIAFALIFLLHVGIGLFLFVGLFFLISIFAALGLLPSGVLDRIEKKFRFPAEKPPTDPDLSFRPSRFRDPLSLLLIGFFVFLNLLENLKHLDWFPYQGGKEIRFVVNTIRLNQYWGMFSPGIQRKDGWLVYHGLDSLGRQWDLRLNQDHVSYDEPVPLVSTFKNDRWRKLSENMQREDFIFLRPLYAGYWLRTWNTDHPEKKITTLNLYFMERENLPDYQKGPVKKILYAVSTQQ